MDRITIERDRLHKMSRLDKKHDIISNDHLWHEFIFPQLKLTLYRNKTGKNVNFSITNKSVNGLEDRTKEVFS